jgi:hypothetical protein
MARTTAARLRLDHGADTRVVGDGGYAIAMTALLIIPMMVATAFSVDYGAWLAQGARMQRAADAASMAGVVWLPNKTKADTEARNVLTANGYITTGGSANATVAFPTLSDQTKYRVELSQGTQRYFSRLFVSNMTMKRSATAEYNKPVPLGSPANKFGNDINGWSSTTPPSCIDPKAGCAGTQPQLWAAIQGPYTRHQDGDAFATKCAGDTTTASTCNNPAPAQNTDYRTSGYLYGVDVPASLVGTPITVQVYDAIHCIDSNSSTYGGRQCYSTSQTTQPDGTSTNDGGTTTVPRWTVESNRPRQWNNMVGESRQTNDYMNTEFELFDSDGSDLTVSTDASLSMSGKCSAGPPSPATGSGRLVVPHTAAANTTTGRTWKNNYKNLWATLCTFTPTKSGIHPLRVKSSAIPGYSDIGGGYNAYSLRATTASATKPKIYGIDDMSIWNNATSSLAKFYLAEIGPEHAGKKLVLDMYDPGDGSGSSAFTMQFRTPPGGAPAAVPGNSSGTTSCKYNGTKSATIGAGTLSSTSSTCTITTKPANSSDGVYNNGWLRVEITLPTTYTCSTDCWWSVWYNFGTGSPTDRTVWKISVVGDPVHLVE